MRRAAIWAKRQERWLNRRSFGRSGASWSFIVQPTLFSPSTPPIRKPASRPAGPMAGTAIRPRASAWRNHRVHADIDPIILGGDTHCYWVTEVKTDYADPASPSVGSEFVTTAVTSHHTNHDFFALQGREFRPYQAF
jgi:alkaline phosphatase D